VLTQLITGDTDISSSSSSTSRLTSYSTDPASVSGSVGGGGGVTSDADSDSVTTMSTLTSSVLTDNARTAVTSSGRTTTAAKNAGIDECIGSVRLAAHTVSITFIHSFLACTTFRVTTHLENLDKSGNSKVVREKSGKWKKVMGSEITGEFKARLGIIFYC